MGGGKEVEQRIGITHRWVACQYFVNFFVLPSTHRVAVLGSGLKFEAMQQLCAAADAAGFSAERAMPAGLALDLGFLVSLLSMLLGLSALVTKLAAAQGITVGVVEHKLFKLAQSSSFDTKAARARVLRGCSADGSGKLETLDLAIIGAEWGTGSTTKRLPWKMV